MTVCLSKSALTEAEVSAVARPGESWASALQRAERLRRSVRLCKPCPECDLELNASLGLAPGWIDDDKRCCPSCSYGHDNDTFSAQAELVADLADPAINLDEEWQAVVAFQQMSPQEQFRHWFQAQGKEYLTAPPLPQLPHLEPIAREARSWVECCDWLPKADRYGQLRYMVYSPSFGGDLLHCQFTDLGWWHDGLEVNISGVTHWRLADADETDHFAAASELPLHAGNLGIDRPANYLPVLVQDNCLVLGVKGDQIGDAGVQDVLLEGVFASRDVLSDVELAADQVETFRTD